MHTESVPILDEEQTNLLIHCAIHFGNNLNIMLQYYKKQGPGCDNNFTIKNIQDLALFQKENPSFIEQTLHIEDLKLIKTHVKQYQQLQEVYDSAPDELSKYICDLILTEDHEPTKEINTIIAANGDAKQRLLTILGLETFHSPLSPGYGLAPYNAAKALGQMKACEAIKPIFLLLQRADFEKQEILIQTLKNIGDPAKKFLISQLQFSPYTIENESAAICLCSFCPDTQILKAASNLLKEKIPHTLKEYLTLLQ